MYFHSKDGTLETAAVYFVFVTTDIVSHDSIRTGYALGWLSLLPEGNMETYDQSRPLGITIIAAVLGISAILALLLLILGLNRVSTLGLGAGMTPATSIALLGALILGFFEVALAWGLWTLRPWAYWTTAVVEGIHLIFGLYAVFVLREAIVAGILSLTIAIVILIYLFADRHVRAAFRSSAT